MDGLLTTLTRLRTHVPHLVGTTVPSGPAWVPGSSFVDPEPGDGDPLDDLFDVDRTGRFALDLPSYASAFYEGYAIRVVGTALGVWLLGEPFPDPDPDSTAIRLAVDLPAEVAFLGDETDDDPRWFVDRALTRHLEPLSVRITERVPLGAQLLRSNLASAVATSGLAVATSLGDASAVMTTDTAGGTGRSVEAFLRALPDDVRTRDIGSGDLTGCAAPAVSGSARILGARCVACVPSPTVRRRPALPRAGGPPPPSRPARRTRPMPPGPAHR